MNSQEIVMVSGSSGPVGRHRSSRSCGVGRRALVIVIADWAALNVGRRWVSTWRSHPSRRLQLARVRLTNFSAFQINHFQQLRSRTHTGIEAPEPWQASLCLALPLT
jgi:hypothetical protein